MPTACSKREAKRFESKKGKSELSPADHQQARHVDTLLQARYTPNGYFYPRLPMTNKPGTLTYSGIIRRREGSIWPGEMIDHCTRKYVFRSRQIDSRLNFSGTAGSIDIKSFPGNKQRLEGKGQA